MTGSRSEWYHGQLRALAADRTLLLTGTRVLVRDGTGRLLLIRPPRQRSLVVAMQAREGNTGATGEGRLDGTVA